MSDPAVPRRRGAFINPDSRGILFLEILLVITLGVVSFIWSYTGLVAVALWAAVPPELVWVVPVTVDGAILVYTLAALVFRARGESSRVAWTSLTLFTGLSVVANGAHAYVEAPFQDGRAVLGMIMASLAPVAVLLTTHTLARLAVERPVDQTAPVVATEAVPAEVRRPVRAVAPVPELVQVPDQPVAAPKAAMDAADRDAQILALRHEEQLSLRAIADRLGISKTTVTRVLDRPRDEPVTA